MDKKHEALRETLNTLMGLTMDNASDCLSKLASSLIHGFWAILALIGSIALWIVVVIFIPISSVISLFKRSNVK